MQANPPKKPGTYRTIKKIGQGSFGEALLAQSLNDNVCTALNLELLRYQINQY